MQKTTVWLFFVIVLMRIVAGFDQFELLTENDAFRKYMNTSADPCDDFYEYTCGNFKNVYPLHEGVATIDHFTLLESKVTETAKSILSSGILPEDPQALRKAKSAYQACVDSGFLDKRKHPELSIVKDEGGFPIVQPDCERDHVAFGWNDIGRFVGTYGVQMMFDVKTFASADDPTKNVIMFSRDPMANPPLLRPYFELSHEEIIEKSFMEIGRGGTYRTATSKAPFDVYLTQLANKIKAATRSWINEDSIQRNIQMMTDFIKDLNAGGYFGNDTVIPIRNSSTITLKDLNEWTVKSFGNQVKIDWVEYTKNIFKFTGISITEDTEVIRFVGLESMLYGILNLVRQSHPSVVKDFVMVRAMLYMAPDGDQESRKALEEFYAKINITNISREKYCTRRIIDSVGTAGLSFAVAYEYQLRHFNVNSLQQAVQMIKDLQSSFKQTLKESCWMDGKSKQLALKKLKNVLTIMAYPKMSAKYWKLDRFYQNLRICKWDNFGNMKRIRAFKLAYQLSQLEKRDRAFWDKSPFEVNAYYNRANNRIIFPIGILNPVFFQSGSSILDYARIGSIIGHEITHGFDMQGAFYDPDGKMEPWWTTETSSAFVNKSRCFVEQYSVYFVPQTHSYINASITLNENIADNGGVRGSYRAMKKLLERERVHIPYKFTAEQLFFIGFGSMWCNNPSNEYLNKMRNNEHATSKWRVNGVVSNMPEFSAAFECPVGSRMNPVNKCRLW